MDLKAHVIELLAPRRIGDEVSPGVRWIGVSTESGLRLTFDARGVEVHVEVAPADGAERFAARTESLVLGYRTASSETSLDPRAGQALCRHVAALIAANESRVLSALAADALRARDVEGATRVRNVVVDSVLEPAGTADARYYTLSPYVGCLIGCRFCYAQTTLEPMRRLERLPQVAWGSWVDARTNAADALARDLETLPPAPIKFCPIVSDPYHALEAKMRLTRGCLETIARAPSWRTVLVLTRSSLVERDAQLIASFPNGYGGVSIPTFDDEVRSHFEPRAASVEERFRALRTLQAAGARTFAIVQPMLPGPLEPFADALAAHVRSVRIDVLHGVVGAAAEFADARHSTAGDDGWQRTRAEALSDALRARGVALWNSELPPEVEPLRGTG